MTGVDGLTEDSYALPRRARYELGKSLRKVVPRASLAEHVRADLDPVEEIARQEEGRVQPLLELRHSRMAASPFSFYRGTAVLMAQDLACSPRGPLSGQVCGDAHVANFGLFAAPDRGVVFDINDFDETHRPAPFDWDVKRLATSVALAALDRGAGMDQALILAMECAQAYREEVLALSRLAASHLWYLRTGEQQILSWVQRESSAQRSKDLKVVSSALMTARARTGWSAVRKLSEETAEGRRFRSVPPLLTPMPEDGWPLVESMYQSYVETCPDDLRHLLAKYRIVDAAHKVVGVGSVGLFSIAVLLQGSRPSDLLVLQAKQAQASVLEDATSPCLTHYGERVVLGQRRLQAAGDIFLGWTTGLEGRQYYVRQLRDMKWSPDLATLPDHLLQAFSRACAGVLARAHCRTSDPAVLAGYLGNATTFDRAVSSYAESYVKQALSDYDLFLHAINDGHLAAGPGQDMTSWWEATLARGLARRNGGRPGTSVSRRRKP